MMEPAAAMHRPEATRSAADLRRLHLGFPYPPYLRRVVRRSARLWMLLRLVGLVLGAVGDLPGALHPPWTTHASLVALTAVLVWWDRRRAHELLLHANLGARPGWFWAASILTATVLDAATQALLRGL